MPHRDGGQGVVLLNDGRGNFPTRVPFGPARATIRAAQAACVNNGALRYAGPDLDTLTGGTNLQADGTHFTDTGNTSAATLWKTALDVVF